MKNPDLLEIHGAGVHVLLAASPVTCVAFREYLRAIGQKPPALMGSGSSTAFVTEVSQVEALAYCQWAGGRDGRAYRLPTMAELQELYSEDAADGISLELWPHTAGHTPEVRGGMKTMFLCEWTAETEKVPQPAGRPPRILGSIFYPPWLRQGANATHAQAHLLATEGYSFVTFRLACDH